MSNEIDTKILNQNIDKTIVMKDITIRKPRSIFAYEYDYMSPHKEITFGGAIYQSLLKAFSSIFEYENLPDELRSHEMEMFLIQSGRLKIIKVGSKFYPVHIAPTKFNNYGDYVESTIIEPFLPALNGLKTEKFKSVEIKNDVLGMSLIRLIHSFVTTIDDTLFNLQTQQSILAGKFLVILNDASSTDDNVELEHKLSNWLTSGLPVKVWKQKLVMDENPLRLIDAPDSTQSFIDVIQFNFSQMLNVLGIPNNNVEGKRERLITTEINIQNVIQAAIIENMLKMRERFCKDFNETFGMNISVKIANQGLEDNRTLEDPEDEGDDTDE